MFKWVRGVGENAWLQQLLRLPTWRTVGTFQLVHQHRVERQEYS